jgi:D-serine deaminase-like pyridoxal phosphate-dependent protein
MSGVAPPAAVGDRLADVDTPALLVDLDAFEANLAAVHRFVDGQGGRVRSHGKAHKCSAIGHRQIAAGAVGLCCQKVGEAEVFVEAGIRDVLVSNVVVGASKARRLARLAGRARVGVCVDSVLQIEQLAKAAREEGTTIELLIEADVGAARCGVTDADEALVLARAINAHRPLLVLRGLQAYHGPAQHLRGVQERAVAIGLAAARAARIASALRAAGYPIEEICGGGTGTYPYELASEVYTEVQPGSYVLMDTDYGANQPDPDVPALVQALGVWCTVITSRPDHAVLDGGLKTFAVDSGAPRVLEPGWKTRGLSDEHTVIVPQAQARPLQVGEKLRLVPGHCDPTVNLHDWIVAHRGDRVEEVWAIDARGALF